MCITRTNTVGLYSSAALSFALLPDPFKLDDTELFDFGIKESLFTRDFKFMRLAEAVWPRPDLAHEAAVTTLK